MVVVVAIVALLSRLENSVGANGAAVIVVNRVAVWQATTIVVIACGYRDLSASRGAVSRAAYQRWESAYIAILI